MARVSILGGTCVAEPGACVKLYCVNGNAATWCNKTDQQMSRPCRDFEQHLKFIAEACIKHWSRLYIKGRVQDADGFTVEMSGLMGERC